MSNNEPSQIVPETGKQPVDKNTDDMNEQQTSSTPDDNVIKTVEQLKEAGKQQVDKNTDDMNEQQASPTPDDNIIKVMEQLKTSAAAWARQFRFEKELQDLSSMISHSPQDPENYLSAGRRYAELGQQKEAIKIFTTALEKVPETHTQYELLRQEKEKAQLRQDHLTDVFGRFSYDIAYHFVDNYFTQQEAAKYTRVCSTWRKKILSLPKIWRRIDGHAEWDKPTKDITPHLLLPSISQHVQELQLPKHQRITSYLNCIRKCNFKHLERLKIITLYCKKQNPLRLIPALRNVSESLTSLDLTLGLNDTNIPTFSDVLRTCRNLLSIRFICSPKKYPVILPLTIHHTTLLKTITLWSRQDNDKINSRELQTLMRLSPDLRCLVIGNCDESVYTAFQEHDSNKIETFTVQHLKGFFSSDTIANSKLDNIENQGEGEEEQRKAEFGGELTNFTAKDFTSPFSLVPVLKRYHTTIRSLCLYVGNTASNLSPPDWQKVLCSYPVHNLSSLRIGHIDLFDVFRRQPIESSAFYVLLTVAPKLSNLESLELYNVKIPDNVLDAIGRLPKLSKLKLTRIHCFSEKLLALLKRFQVKSNYTAKRRAEESLSSLTQLDLDATAVNPDIAEAACKIQTLTHLYISDVGNRYGVFDTFVQEVAKLPLLEDLEIGNAQKLTLDDFEVLSTMVSLRRLGLFRVDKNTHENIQKITFPSHIDVITSKYEKKHEDEYERTGVLILS